MQRACRISPVPGQVSVARSAEMPEHFRGVLQNHGLLHRFCTLLAERHVPSFVASVRGLEVQSANQGRLSQGKWMEPFVGLSR